MSVVKKKAKSIHLNFIQCCRIKFNNIKILDLFLSAVSNSSGGFIAAADAVS